MPHRVFIHELAGGKVMAEWQEIIDRDYNHPCITTWVPINESWGYRTLVSIVSNSIFRRRFIT